MTTGPTLPAAGLVFLALALVVSAGVPYLIVRRLVAYASDHAFHVYLIRHMRENGRRMVTRMPRLVNDEEAEFGYPQFLHWALSWLPDQSTPLAALFLNPVVNGVQVVVTFGALCLAGVSTSFAGAASLLVAFTPQLFHLANSRGHGLSARPIGWLLVIVQVWSCYFVGVRIHPQLAFPIGVAAGYLIWGTSKFGQQGMVVLSLLWTVLFRSSVMLLEVMAATALFVLVHRGYAVRYLRNYAQFLRTYATQWADLMLLSVRPSIWRDLVIDIPRRLRCSVLDGARYAYENTVVIVALLNPLTLVAALLWLRSVTAPPLVIFCVQATVAGLAATIATSFRRTRFLGEPERYAELVIPFATLAGAWALIERFGVWALAAVAVGYLVLDGVQVASAFRLAAAVERRYRGGPSNVVARTRETLRTAFEREPVRFASNQVDLVKRLMAEPWSFLWIGDTGTYGGIPLREVFDPYPIVRKAALEQMLGRYRVNACLLDKTVYGTLFDGARIPLRPLFETERYILYRIDW